MAYEVLRGGQGYSVITPQAGDIIKKQITRAHGKTRTAANVSIKGNEVFINGVGYSVTPEQQAAFIIQQTNGYGASARAAISQATATAKKIKEDRAKAQAAAEAEQKRIADLKTRLLAANARKSVVTRRNKEGDIIERSTTIQGLNKKIITTENLLTGEVSYKTYRSGMLSGGLTEYRQTPAEVENIKKELYSAKLTPIISDNQVTGFYYNKKAYKLSAENLNKVSKEINLDIILKNIGLKTNGKVSYESDFPKSSVEKILTKITKYSNKQISSLKISNIKTEKKINDLKNKIANLEKYGKSGRAKALRLALTQGTTLILDKYLSYASEVAWEAPAAAMPVYEIGKLLKENPKNIVPISASIWSGLKQYTKDTVELARTDPVKGVIRIGIDYYSFDILSDGIVVSGKIVGKLARRLNPKWKSFRKGILKINPTDSIFIRRGKKVYLAKRVKSTKLLNLINRLKGVEIKTMKKLGLSDNIIDSIVKIRRGGQFKKFTKTPSIELKLGTIGKGVPLSEQVKLAGSTRTITSAQADNLLRFINRIKSGRNFGLIRKPIPNESNFTKLTKQLLKKFDDGRITKAEFNTLNKRVFKESNGKTLLERSLYADPSGTVRFTRLGKDVAQEANLRDILTGNFRILKDKPVIYVFPDGQISKWPKSLQKIYNKLRDGKPLTFAEDTKLKRWQTKYKDPRWKNVGDIRYKGGSELEVTLAPGNYIRKVKTLAITEINGIKVPILQLKVIQLKSKTVKLLNKAKIGNIKLKEAEMLRAAIIKETKSKITIKEIMNMSKTIRRKSASVKPYLYPGRKIGRTVKTTAKILKATRARPKTKAITTRSKARVTMARPKTKATRTRSKARTTRTRPKTKARTTRPTKTFTTRTLSKPVQTYYVVEKKKGKFVKLYPKPLKAKDAKDYAVYQIDHNLSKTAFFIPLGKNKSVVRPPKNIQGYYDKHSNKVRPYRIRYGSKRLMVNGFIEKRKYFQDTTTERQQAARLRSKAVKKKTSTTRTKATQAQLKALKKARAARARKAKK